MSERQATAVFDAFCAGVLLVFFAFVLSGCVTPSIVGPDGRHAPASGSNTTTTDTLLLDTTNTYEWDDRQPADPPPPTKADTLDGNREATANLRDCLSISAKGTACLCFDGLNERTLARMPEYKRTCLEAVDPQPDNWPEQPPPVVQIPTPKPNPGVGGGYDHEENKGKQASFDTVEGLLDGTPADANSAECYRVLALLVEAVDYAPAVVNRRNIVGLASEPRSWYGEVANIVEMGGFANDDTAEAFIGILDHCGYEGSGE